MFKGEMRIYWSSCGEVRVCAPGDGHFGLLERELGVAAAADDGGLDALADLRDAERADERDARARVARDQLVVAVLALLAAPVEVRRAPVPVPANVFNSSEQ